MKFKSRPNFVEVISLVWFAVYTLVYLAWGVALLIKGGWYSVAGAGILILICIIIRVFYFPSADDLTSYLTLRLHSNPDPVQLRTDSFQEQFRKWYPRFSQLFVLGLVIYGGYQTLCGPRETDRLNLGFEEADEEIQRPVNWIQFDSLSTTNDGLRFVVQHQEHHDSTCALLVENTLDSTIHYVRSRYGKSMLRGMLGKRLVLGGWIKNESISDYAGLWIRSVARKDTTFNVVKSWNNLNDANQSWQYYEIAASVEPYSERVDFGVVVSGKGKAYFDGLTLDTNGGRFAN